MTLESGNCSIAFKEWVGVCGALAQGRQSIIVRKGGIREGSGPGAFLPEHDQFWLYPTLVHQGQQGLRLTDEGPPRSPASPGPGGSISIGILARVEWIGRVQDEALLPSLEEFHILTAETIRGRFRYRMPGLWVLLTRIWRREPSFEIRATAAQAGCKTWVVLDEALSTTSLQPALGDSEWARRREQLRAVFAGETVPAAPT